MTTVAEAFNAVAERQFAKSPLFSSLCRAAADDDAVSALTARCPDLHQAPMILMAAVHGLLLNGHAGDPLGAYFGTIAQEPLGPSEAWPEFRRFIAAHQDAIAEILATKGLIKTDLRRSACLRPLIVEAARRLGTNKVHLVDIGCSAGLNLLVDGWQIAYGGHSVGPSESAVRVTTDVRGNLPPLAPMPEIVSRTGIDLNLPDLSSEEDRTWVLAHTFPEEPEMLTACRAAIEALMRHPPHLIRGDGIALLDDAIGRLDPAHPVIVMHSMTTIQFSDAMRHAFNAALERCAGARRLARISMEMVGPGASLCVSGRSISRPDTVGRADIDGRWMQWLLAPA